MCPRGEIGRHNGLKIRAFFGVPVRVWPRAPFNLGIWMKILKKL